jgi:hypothetical protein
MSEFPMLREKADLQKAYDGSFYFIAGCGGDLDEWVTGYEKFLDERDCGKPTAWLQTTGKEVNEFAGENDNPYQAGLICLMFPLDGMEVGPLAMVKILMQDRWFDDVIDNMRVTREGAST